MQVLQMKPFEQVVLDQDRLSALYSELGPVGAEDATLMQRVPPSRQIAAEKETALQLSKLMRNAFRSQLAWPTSTSFVIRHTQVTGNALKLQSAELTASTTWLRKATSLQMPCADSSRIADLTNLRKLRRPAPRTGSALPTHSVRFRRITRWRRRQPLLIGSARPSSLVPRANSW